MAVARRASRRRYVLLVIVLTTVTLITLDTRNGRSGPLGALGRGAHAILAPVQSAVDSVTSPVSDWWDGVIDSGHLKHENQTLRDRLAAAEGRLRDADRAREENKNLNKILGLRSLYDVPLVDARVVGRDPGNFDSTLTIDHGTERGIAVDMPVVGPDGSLVGTVIQSGRGFAVIRVLTDPEFAVGVKLPAHPGSDASTSIAQGQTDSSELIDVVDDTSKKVLPGDPIVTSASAANLYPPDVPIGRVSRVVPQPGGQPTRIFIKPYADLGALDFVSVMRWVQGNGAVVITTTTTTSTTSTTMPGATTTTSVGP
jgi:rod shape-determining protein MreC